MELGLEHTYAGVEDHRIMLLPLMFSAVSPCVTQKFSQLLSGITASFTILLVIRTIIDFKVICEYIHFFSFHTSLTKWIEQGVHSSAYR